MNQNTHFLDLSAVYGSSEEVALEVRTFKNGALNVTRLRKGYHYQMDLLPPDDVGPEISTCALSKAVSGIDPPPEVRCFKAGEAARHSKSTIGWIFIQKAIFCRRQSSECIAVHGHHADRHFA